MITTFLLTLSLSVEPRLPVSKEPPARAGRLVRLVGEQLSFEPIECLVYRWSVAGHGPDEEDGLSERAPCDDDDLRFRARYRVLQVIDGEAGEEVEFLATGWTTDFAESRHALLYVLESPDGALLPPGVASPVYPTRDGGWATCDNYRGSQPVAFPGGIVFGRTNGMSPHGIAQRYPALDYRVVGQKAFCLRGRRLPVLIEELDRELDRLRDAGYPYLPPKEDQAASP